MGGKSDIDVVFFDLGNVLVPLDFERAYRAAAERTGLSPDEVAERLGASGLAGPYERGELSSADFHKRCAQALEMEIELEAFAELWGNMFGEHELTSAGTVEAVAGTARIALLSNTNELHMRWLDARYPILELFKTRILSYEVGALKPDRHIYQAAVSTVGVQPTACFFTDDRPENVAGARQFGMDAELFTDAANLERQLEQRGLL